MFATRIPTKPHVHCPQRARVLGHQHLELSGAHPLTTTRALTDWRVALALDAGAALDRKRRENLAWTNPRF